MAIRPPRRSALGVTWCEDATRGLLGVRKNQGIFHGACGIDPGGWIRTFVAATSWLQYPHQLTRNRTGITVICRVKDFVHSGVTQFILGQGSSVAWDANIEFMLYVNATDTMAFYLNRDGAAAAAVSSIALLTAADTMIGATWDTADNMRIFVNGEQNNVGAVAAGTINDVGQPLTVGLRANGDVPFSGAIKPELVDFRRWSDDEIRNYYRRSTFH